MKNLMITVAGEAHSDKTFVADMIAELLRSVGATVDLTDDTSWSWKTGIGEGKLANHHIQINVVQVNKPLLKG